MTLSTSYFSLTYSSQAEAVGILATVDGLQDDLPYTETLVYTPRTNTWIRDDGLRGIRATSFVLESPLSIMIGDRGQVWVRRSKRFRRAQLPDSGLSGRHLGTPNRIRMIAGRPYVCGFAGQFYTAAGALEDLRWVHMDDGLAETEGTGESIDLEDLDGTAADDITTVGSHGLIAHWDGHRWSRVKVLTNAHLGAVRRIGREHIVAVGGHGTIVEFDGLDWRVETIPGADNYELFDVQDFGDRLYVAAGLELFVRIGATWDRVQHGLDKRKTDFHRLTVGAGRLWAMGRKRLSSFDGNAWQSHVDPDNV